MAKRSNPSSSQSISRRRKTGGKVSSAAAISPEVAVEPSMPEAVKPSTSSSSAVGSGSSGDSQGPSVQLAHESNKVTYNEAVTVLLKAENYTPCLETATKGSTKSDTEIARVKHSLTINRLFGRQLAVRLWPYSMKPRFIIENIPPSFRVTDLPEADLYGIDPKTFDYATELQIWRYLIGKFAPVDKKEVMSIWISAIPCSTLFDLRILEDGKTMNQTFQQLKDRLQMQIPFDIHAYQRTLMEMMHTLNSDFINGLVQDDLTWEFPVPLIPDGRRHEMALYIKAVLLKVIPEISNLPNGVPMVMAIKEDMCLYLASCLEKPPVKSSPLNAIDEIRSFWNKKIFLTMNQYASLFSTKLVNVDYIRDLSALIHYYRELFPKEGSGIHAPYIAICQGSGVGKTKTVLSLAYSNLLFYMSLRLDAQTGFPPACKLRDKIVGLKDPGHFGRFIGAILDVFCEQIDGYHKNAKVLEAEYVQIFKVPETMFLKVFSDLLASPNSTVHGEFWDAVEEKRKDLPDMGRIGEGLVTRFAAVESKISDLLGISKIPILFAFDEARNLLTDGHSYTNSAFRAARHTCQTFTHNGFMLFMDTSSRTTNFAPAITRDPSKRISQESDLLPPVIYLPCVGFLKLNPHVLEIDDKQVPPFDPLGYPSLKYHVLKEIEVGRPMFTAEINELAPFLSGQSQATNESAIKLDQDLEKILNSNDRLEAIITHITKLAEQKVYGGMSLQAEPLKSLFPALAAIKYGVRFFGLTMNNSIMSSHMGIATHISHDREDLLIQYPGEPLISEAATRIMKPRFLEFLKSLGENIRKGACQPVGAGEVGELVAPILVSYAMDNLTDPEGEGSPAHIVKTRYSAPVATGHFLTKLLPRTMMAKIAKLPGYPVIMNSFVAFSSFVRVSTPLTSAMLLRAWERRVALYCKTGASGIDFVVPIVMPYSKKEAPVTAGSSKGKKRVTAEESEEQEPFTAEESKEKTPVTVEASEEQAPGTVEASEEKTPATVQASEEQAVTVEASEEQAPGTADGSKGKTPVTAEPVTVEASEDNISCIVFQAKNIKDAIGGKDLKTALLYMTLHASYGVFKIPPPLGILLQVGEGNVSPIDSSPGNPSVWNEMIFCALSRAEVLESIEMPPAEQSEILKLSQISATPHQRIQELFKPVFQKPEMTPLAETESAGKLETAAQLVDSFVRPIDAGPPPHPVVEDMSLLAPPTVIPASEESTASTAGAASRGSGRGRGSTASTSKSTML